ncbi:MAG: glycosyltransferase [Flavobacterium sp.]|nr:MAG: glycosyltransferase [Flavobacterium sp.]
MPKPKNNLEIFIDGLYHGGAEHLLLSMLPTFCENYSPEIFTFGGDFPLQKKAEEYCKVTKLKAHQVFVRIWKSQSPCYIGLSKMTMIALLVNASRYILRLKPKTIICHEHTSFNYHTGRKLKRKKIFDFFYRNLILFCLRKEIVFYVVSTNARRREIKPFVKNQENIHQFPSSFKSAKIDELLQSRKTFIADVSRKFRLFTFSRLDQVKQLTWAIDAAASIALLNPATEVTLDICGTGDDRERLEKHARSKTEGRNLQINFLGFVETISKPLSTSDLFLFPSRVEGFPLSLTEAAISGITCISNNCPHGPEDIAEHFPNVVLATPPSKENFIKLSLDMYSKIKSGTPTFSQKSPIGNWPSIEILTQNLSKFIEECAAQKGEDSISFLKKNSR